MTAAEQPGQLEDDDPSRSNTQFQYWQTLSASPDLLSHTRQTMFALYKLVAFPFPRHHTRRVVLCSSAGSSGAMSASPESWPTPPPLTKESPHLNKRQAVSRARKRLLIAGVDQADLVDPWLLAESDSRFAELYGVHIHYKIATGRVNEVDDDAAVRKDDVADRDDLASRDDATKVIEGSNGYYASSPSPSVSLSPQSSDVSSSSSDSSECTSPHSQPLPSPEAVPPSQLHSIPAILLHGFGASLFSWERVLKRLADVLRSRVIAFDRPAFGLTSRISVPFVKSASGRGGLIPIAQNPYTVAFSSAATLAFIDFLKASKAILIGHSAGCIIAADAYLKAPERIAAMILVAPALFAPFMSKKKEHVHQNQNSRNNVLTKFWLKAMSVLRKIGEFIRFVVSFIRLLCYRILAAFLRSDVGYWLVRAMSGLAIAGGSYLSIMLVYWVYVVLQIRTVMDKLSLQAVQMAWYDKKKIDDYVISGYTKPLRCRHWEQALLEYVIALVGDPSLDEKTPPISQRLEEILCPVLVITGDSDALVPSWNAERLSRILPNAQFHVIKNCGHLPQEETPEEFLRIVRQFVQQVQQGSMKEQATNETAVFMPA